MSSNETKKGSERPEKSTTLTGTLKRSLYLGPQNPVDKAAIKPSLSGTGAPKHTALAVTKRPLTARLGGRGPSNADDTTKQDVRPQSTTRAASSLIAKQSRISDPSQSPQEVNMGVKFFQATDMSNTGKFQHSSVPRVVPARAVFSSNDEPGSAAAAAAESLVADTSDAAHVLVVAERLRRWYVALQAFKRQPDSLEFVYMRHAEPYSVHWNPYNIEVVPHAQIKGLSDYYTMSGKGITHFVDGSADFNSLEGFERDFFLFSKLMRFKLFRTFRLWKSFKMWRRNITARKSHHSRDVLQGQLFILNPVFREAMLRVRKSCMELSQLRLHALKPGTVYSLEDMIQAHSGHREGVTQVLLSFSRAMVNTAQIACRKALELMEEKLLEGKTQGGLAGVTIKTNVRQAVAKAAQLADQAEFSYAMSAARRTEKRRVRNFVRVLDYMICNTLHMLLESSIHDIMSALTPAPSSDIPVAEEAEELDELGLPRKAANILIQWGKPLLLVTLKIDPETGDLFFDPAADDFLKHMSAVQVSFVEHVKLVTRLITDPRLQDFMESTIDGGVVDAEALMEVVLGEDHMSRVESVIDLAEATMASAAEYRDSFTSMRDVVVQNRLYTINSMRSELAQGLRTLNTFRVDLDRFQKNQGAVRSIQRQKSLGVLLFQLGPLLDAFEPSFVRCLQQVHELLPMLAEESYRSFISKVHGATSRLQTYPSNVEEFASYMDFLSSLEFSKPQLDSEFDVVVAHYDLLTEYDISAPPIQLAAFATMESDYATLREVQWHAEGSKDAMIQRFRVDLDNQVEDLLKEVVDIRLLAQHDMILDEQSEIEDVLSYTQGLLDKVESQQARAQQINKFQRQFKLEETNFVDLEDCSEDVNLRHQLWDSRQAWTELTEKLLKCSLSQVDVQTLEEAVARYNRAVMKMERGLIPNKIVPLLREGINSWREFVPIIQSLRNPDMRDRHWAKVKELTGLVIDQEATLGALMSMQVMRHRESITRVSTEAMQEAGLVILLERVVEKWKNVEFTINPYKEMKDGYVLGEVDEILLILEDSLQMISTIMSSRFVGGIRPEVEKVERSLRLFGDTLDAWLECQGQWLYLETIFGASDIQRQLPAEAKAFAQVDRQFKEAMRKARDRPNALQTATAPGMLEIFLKCNDTLELVQKNLEDYLETKRVSFPRFYFLSNDELLEILSQTKNPQAVQPHLQKCFDGIRYLEFGEEAKSIEILSMLSGEGEKVSLGKNLKARGSVEVWLTSVETSMKASVRALSKKGMKEYLTTPRKTWVLQNPAQLVLVISNIYWSMAVEERLSAVDATFQLSKFLEHSITQLGELTALVRGQLSPLERKVLSALITIDVHNRDIVDNLALSGCKSPSEFMWQMQLRYDYDPEAEAIFIKQVNARFEYGYEYLGAQPRLVVTPMTDRCYLTLTGALHLKLGGAPAGPAGTGKTETTKDLAKALGVQCVVFNCGENLDYKFMGKFFSGLAQCGAWACLDEFNRIDIEVLSVVAQQLLAIQNALKAHRERFLFEGREIRLQQTCGVFITMNPGYAGRTELPDNLKALFRPVSMMIPDYALVAEVMLFSEGFDDAKNLSRKMVQLYKLSSEQLSQQDHYDFGMRALKSVLLMAGTLKRANPSLSEDVVLIRAMRDSNIPKFLSEDARLFNAIVSDLFPEVSVPTQDFGSLQTAVVTACRDRGLQPTPAFVTKVVQLHETFNVRFGVMLVGPTGGGKTQCYKTLQRASSLLKEQDSSPENSSFQVVHTSSINPKSVKMGELYGEYNLLTNEWQDGIASSLIRIAAGDNSKDHHWILFDGPVDAVWVENMNTVLDDNCMLCLPNGERIKLNPATMHILFEVQDLAVASPATVSRCGMVYVPPESLGWRPFIQSWLARLSHAHHALMLEAEAAELAAMASGEGQSALSGEPSTSKFSALSVTYTPAPENVPVYHPTVIAFIYGLFERFIDPLLSHIRRHCTELIASVDLNLVTSVAKIFEASARPGPGLDLTKPLDDQTQISLNYCFGYSIIWGVGGNLSSDSWDKFDVFARKLLEGTANFPGGSGTVFDYRLDIARGFALTSWAEIVPKYRYDPAQPYFQILVHTVDSIRMSALLETCLSVRRPVLFNGLSGVGKSALIRDTLERLAAQRGQAGDSGAGKAYMPVALNFSAQTSSHATQAQIESYLEKKRRTRFGAPAGKHIVLFVDDLNMPTREVYGAQPPLELLRQLLDNGGFYDRKKLFWKDIEDVTMVAACGPAGGGRQEVSQRLLRQFTMLCVPAHSEAAMRLIFSSILGGFFAAFFNQEVRERVLRPMVECSIEVYLRIANELLPTPSKSHYTFNLRDVSKVFQGLVSIRPGQCPVPHVTLTRLWIHENLRVFHDRLTTEEDKEYLKHMLFELLQSRFDIREDYPELFVKKEIIFGDFLRMGAASVDRVYEEVMHPEKLQQLLENYLGEYNMEHKNELNLVFFSDAVSHICRIARILRQPRGSAMLVGVGGSGKQSLTRFAAFISDAKCMTIELTRNYGLTEFREDIKKMFKLCGCDGKRVAFLFTDSHVVNESFVEDINSLLNSGEITGLFPQDERDRVFSEFQEWVTEHGIEDTKDAMWKAFIGRVRDNLHLVLAMSPVGEAFRARCRQFPSLINCTTIDWFSPWPEEALLSVSSRFLSNQQHVGSERVNRSVAEMCVNIHTSVDAMAGQFYQELRRRYYVTPKSYLDLIMLYIKLLQDKRQEMALARDRLLNGLQKLQDTNAVVDKMQQELNDLQPILASKTADTEQLLQQVEAESLEAEIIRSVVMNEEQEVKTKQIETQGLKDEAQLELEEVLPALEAAEKALNALNKNDIVEIKTFTKPPILVQLTMEAVCILLQEKPDWDTAKKVLGESGFVKRLVDFDKDNIHDRVVRGLRRIIDDATFTPDQVAKQSKAAMSMCLWVRAMDTYAKVVKIVEPKRHVLQVAQAALDVMNAKLVAKQTQLQEIVDKVERLKVSLETTQAELESLQHQADLSRKRLARASRLTNALGDESVRWKSTAEDLSDRMLLLVGDVLLSAACISYMGAFTGSYRQKLVQSWILGCQEREIPASPSFSLQDTLSSQVQIREWNVQGLPSDPVSTDNGILVTMGSRWPLMIDPQDQANRWIKAKETRNGLRSIRAGDPNIMRTLESCVRIGNPVLLEHVGEAIDPALDSLLQRQTFMQGTRTLIRFGDSDVDYDPSFKFYMTSKLPNPHFLPEICIKVNVINFTVTVQGLEDQLLGDVVRKERPDLEEAKDGLVVSISNDKKLLQDLEDKILRLLRDSTGNILDDEILINTLNTSKNTSATIQVRVKEAEETEKEINNAREVYRPVPIRGSLLYFVVADMALIDPMYQYSLSYFTRLFGQCLDASEESSDLSVRLENMLSYITEFIYRTVCRGLFERHRLLFSFLISVSIQRYSGRISYPEWDFLLRGAARSGGVGNADKHVPEEIASWMSSAKWGSVRALERVVPALSGLVASVLKQAFIWKRFAENPFQLSRDDCQSLSEGINAEQKDLGTLSSAATDSKFLQGLLHPGSFTFLLAVKTLCEDKLVAAVHEHVAEVLGQKFVESPSSSVLEIYNESSPVTPVIFVLSQGADPMSSLARFSLSQGRAAGGPRLQVISLGQGQGPIAESTLSSAVKTGAWVCLQNCHLAKSWMPKLEAMLEDIQQRYERQEKNASRKNELNPMEVETDFQTVPGGYPVEGLGLDAQSGSTQYDVHPDFRMWLTSMPAPHFPVQVLQSGVKVTMEPPQGIRANMLRTFSDMPATFLDDTSNAGSSSPDRMKNWRSLVFACSFFHALIQERRKFGPLGWNIRYDFSAGDLDCALQTLRMFVLNKTDDSRNSSSSSGADRAGLIPWEALGYVTGEINYGGRVTDDNDRRLLICTLERFYNKGSLSAGHTFCGSQTYRSPEDGSLESYLSYIRAWPQRDEPEVFGMHDNANVIFNLQESNVLLENILSLQPRVAELGSSGKSSETIVLDAASEILALLPEPLDVEKHSVVRNPFSQLSSGHENSLGTVLLQETHRFNTLLSVMMASLKELAKAVKGFAVMSSDLEAMFTSILNNQVPALWRKSSYPSLKPLSSWVSNFRTRMDFMSTWLYDGEPSSYWLSGFFFPQGFLTAVLQNHARRMRTPIDKLVFGFGMLSSAKIADESRSIKSAVTEGVIVHGLFIESASWDLDKNVLVESKPFETFSRLPAIHLIPKTTPPGQSIQPQQGGGAEKEGQHASIIRSTYQCPLYKTSARAGILSTTGQSTNFILHMDLPCAHDVNPARFVLSGTAALCELSHLDEEEENIKTS
ncbi:hypothetical protein CEUSTIGMA_g1069.t1 [Chlamydomonas eustigma]|uniref:AAA+ ATPase domain-containing protein n=1 Tax=Chlamydomonas eustigma TaxID=1157962 RepID=A0A250WS03_9CHLO|nr:hypothetical protein CEUSTIGMA_g1069.t1 [Chlamydomonas eustigma]|eukprot:GAX73618.1 hypothetical protein CEUSTIGMA_g1069.t1 [Chlamydomonas eustigma]